MYYYILRKHFCVPTKSFCDGFAIPTIGQYPLKIGPRFPFRAVARIERSRRSRTFRNAYYCTPLLPILYCIAPAA